MQPFDEQIQFQIAIDSMSFVIEGNRPLVLDRELFLTHFDDHAFTVHGLQQAGSQRSVHFNGATNHFVRQRFDLFQAVSHIHGKSTNRACRFPE